MSQIGVKPFLGRNFWVVRNGGKRFNRRIRLEFSPAFCTFVVILNLRTLDSKI